MSNWWEFVPLHEALLACAGQHASAAYEITGCKDPRADSFAAARASIHAGAAVELLAKSLLAREHPALIMKDPADAVPPKRHPLELTNTADAATLQSLLCRHLQLETKVKDLGAGILNDRNFAVHVGLSTRTVTENVDRLGLWIYFVQEASGLTGADWLSPEAAIEQERRFNAFVLNLYEKTTAARRLFRKKRADRQKASKDFEAWATGLERERAESASLEIGPDFDDAQECPSCPRMGHAWGVVDIEFEYEGPGEYSENALVRTFFECAVCELQLNDAESAVIFSPEWKDLEARLETISLDSQRPAAQSTR